MAAGAIAAKLLSLLGIRVTAYTRSIGPIMADLSAFDREAILRTPTAMPDYHASLRAESYLRDTMEALDSAGGVMECLVEGMPAGIGEPVFDKLDACLSKAVMSIGAVKAVEIGDGIKVSEAKGSDNNDAFYMDGSKVSKRTNHAGGILGGISDGSPILVRAHVKPTPSIFRTQETVDKNNRDISVQIKGRHDPVIVPRAVVVMEAMVALTIADALLLNMSAQTEHMIQFYHRPLL